MFLLELYESFIDDFFCCVFISGRSYEEQSRVYNVTFSAKKTIRDLRLGGNNVGRTVGVEFRTTQMLKFQIRELEIYNGRLPGSVFSILMTAMEKSLS